MAKIDVLDILRAKKRTPLEFDYDSLWIPPMNVFLTQDDVESLRRIATSLRLSSKIELKYKMIDDIMRNRGFRRFSAGTNRVVYYFLEDTRFVVKIAVDRVGMQDNPMEFENQILLKPYCAKMFYISPCGTVGFAERVLPIKNKNEFKEIAPDIFEILVNKILGNYVVEDVGTKYFMNWGIRKFDAPVLLDYPFIYKLDGKKLFCNKVHPVTNEPCNGEIDYDAGFNHLTCTRCGKIYLATDLRDNSIDNKIIIKGGTQMKIMLRKGDEIISKPIPADDIMIRRNKKPEYKVNRLVVKAVGGGIEECEQKTTNPLTVENVSNNNSDITATENHDFDFDTKSKFIDAKALSTEEESDIGNSTQNANMAIDEIIKKSDETHDSVSELYHYAKTTNSETEDSPQEDVGDDSIEPDTEEFNTDSMVIITPEELDSTDKSKSILINTDDSDDEKPTSDNSSDDDYNEYDNDDDEPRYKPIRRKSTNVERERDANGRFVSSKKKSSTKRIPSINK